MTIKSRLLAAALCLCGISAAADPLTIASASKTSSTYPMALAISAALDQQTGAELRPQPYKSTSQGLPFVAMGEIDFGLENSVALREAYFGTGAFKDSPFQDLRLVARLQPLRMALGVRQDSGIDSVSDLRGKRMPAQFRTTVTGELLIAAMLAAGGIGYEDVTPVSVSDFTDMKDTFVAGATDAMIHVIGSPRDEQVSNEIGGLKVIDIPMTEESRTVLAEIFPAGAVVEIQPEPELTTITRPTTVLQYDYFIYTSAQASDADVIALLEALREGKATMVSAVASLRWFDPEDMEVDIGLPYHPAALTYYAQNGDRP